MDDKRFEALSRRVAEAGSRRATLAALTVALAASVLRRPDDAAAGLPIVHCKAPGKKCDKNKKCCSGHCKRGHCSCSKRGRRCWAPLEGALCCSQKCQNGKCG
jgi:hypothetical protein